MVKLITRRDLTSAVIGAVIGLVLALLLSYANLIPINSKSYVFVDVEKVIKSVNDSISANLKSDSDVSKMVNQAKAIFKEEIDNYAKSRKAIVFSSPYPIAGADDITKIIEARVITRIENNENN